MRTDIIQVAAPNGLCGRKLSQFIDCALKFQSKSSVVKSGRSVDAKSLMGMLAIAVGGGETIQVVVDGKDEDKAIAAIVNEINRCVSV